MYMKGLKNTPNCEQCNLNVHEDVEHVLFFCPKYEDNRKRLIDKLKEIGINQVTKATLLGAAVTEESKKRIINEEVGTFLKKSTRYREL